MKYMNHFRLCLMYQKHELLQDFVHYFIQCEGKAKVFLDEWIIKIYMCMKLFLRLVLKILT